MEENDDDSDENESEGSQVSPGAGLCAMVTLAALLSLAVVWCADSRLELSHSDPFPPV